MPQNSCLSMKVFVVNSIYAIKNVLSEKHETFFSILGDS